MTIDLATARQHCKSDGDDDALLQVYLNSAQSICENYCNRYFYTTAEQLASAGDDAVTALKLAQTTRTNALIDVTDSVLIAMINDRYLSAVAECRKAFHGKVIDGNIDAAILLTVGHLYKNREDNIVDSATAQQMPVGAIRILQPYLWIGDLADPPGVGCLETGS